MIVNTLRAANPYTKKYWLELDGSIGSSDWPKVFRVSSQQHQVFTLDSFASLIEAAGAAGHCIVKGVLNKALVSESWAGSTNTHTPTAWACLDFDGVPYASVDDAMEAVGLGDISYVRQWSASSGIKDGIRAHAFVLLDQAQTPDVLTAWLTTANYATPTLAARLALAKGDKVLTFVLDRLSNMSGRVLYVAPPELRDIEDPHPHDRVAVVRKQHDMVPTSHIVATSWPKEKLSQMHAFHVARLRAEKDLPPLERKAAKRKLEAILRTPSPERF